MIRAVLALALILAIGITGAKEILEVEAILRAGAEGPYRPREICLVRDNVNLCKSKVTE